MANINLQSLTNKMDQFMYFLYEQNVDLACVTEHWATYEILERINSQNHKVGNAFCRASSRHGGAAIIMRNDISFNELNELRNLSFDKKIKIAAVRLNKLNIILIAIYRPPSSDIHPFLSILDDVLESCYTEYCS
ncbi:hypothetical protein WA026_014180 [Henosepilachna vigintioctopunctata]|uniref:Profilin n=1 Tax=Henosepilachna vigintioctopunctata TaxID=420089 RepID=A0AAW1TUE8_9CUCU